MKRFKIFHKTNYDFSDHVTLLPHTIRLRPREGHELSIESSQLDISPDASLRWHRDIEGNSVGIASFPEKSRYLYITSEVIVQQFNQEPFDFLISTFATNYPFDYPAEAKFLLAPYMQNTFDDKDQHLAKLIDSIWGKGKVIDTLSMLIGINELIYHEFNYCVREEPGVQTVEETLTLRTGSCRDVSFLFMEVVRLLGFAARFVSGYVYANSPVFNSESTHAWAEVFIPGAGWKGFDSTTGLLVGSDHIPVAISRLPESVPPVQGSYIGSEISTMSVHAYVSEYMP